jgi:pentatricopeptide repeat protein
MPNLNATTALHAVSATSIQAASNPAPNVRRTKGGSVSKVPVGHPDYRRSALDIPTRKSDVSQADFRSSVPAAANSNAIANFTAHRISLENLLRITTSAIVEANGPEEAKACIRALTAAGIQPSLHNYTAWMSVCVKHAKPDEAKKVLNEMHKKKLEVDAVAFNILISGYAHEHQVEAAKQTFERMVSEGISPTLSNYNSLMHAYAKTGRAAEAQQVFDTIPEHLRHDPVAFIVAFNTLILAYINAGQLDDASRVFSDTMKMGFEPNAVSYATLISGFADNSQWDQVDALIQSARDRKVFKAGLGFDNPTLMNFHENSVFTHPPHQDSHVRGISAGLAKALFRHHLLRDKISAQTRFVVGSHGANRLKDVTFELMQAIGMEPQEGTYRSGETNPGVLVAGHHDWPARKSIRLDPRAAEFVMPVSA